MKTENIQLDFNFCRQLDFQKKGDSPRLKSQFKSLIYKQDIISQKHILFLLTELFCCWKEAKEQFLAVSMSKRGYKAKSRYNLNKISSYLIYVIRYFRKEGLIEFYPGFFDTKKKISRLSRIRPSAKLIEEFKKINISCNELLNIKSRETIYLLDKNENLVEYNDDFFSHEAREILKNYNSNLSKTFFDVASLEKPFFVRGDNARIPISHFCCINKRIFSESWIKGGIFTGSWWSKLDPFSLNKISSHMLINDSETSYVDLSSIFSLILSSKTKLKFSSIEKELDFLKKKNSFIKNINQLIFIVEKSLNYKNHDTFYRSFCLDRKKVGIFEKITKNQFFSFLDNYKQFSPKIYNLSQSNSKLSWNKIVSEIFYELIKSFGTSNVPIILVLDRIFYPTKVHKNIMDYLNNFLSKYTNYEKIQLKYQKCYAYNFGGKDSIFDSLIGNNLSYSQRFLNNKKSFFKHKINN